MTDQVDPERVRGGQMTDAEIDAYLDEQGTGVLSLAEGSRAYAIPISFGYETGRAVFSYWQFGSDSRKKELSESTERACLTVYDIESQTDWRSVLAFGTLRELPTAEWRELGELIDQNAWSPDLTPIGKRRLSVVGYELSIEEATGLQRHPDTERE
ncbi:pyridoxamine 5'-phosphate oxidase family protein [Halobellus rufus]|uniref:pyridoxamine 5'-phosphate oxidase family protein n=1 Tax=Halobellus rufus TaxID=1448860 RepID=UPI000679991B|nr:pyridoxamine 5'-phosphate oxidase family protein [Halobellus rufus]